MVVNRNISCTLCLIESRVKDLLKLGVESPKAIAKLLIGMANLLECDRTCAFVESFEIVKSITGLKDPYHKLKVEIERFTENLLSTMNIERNAKLSELFKLASSANIIDSHVLAYEFSLDMLKGELFSPKIAIDDSEFLDDVTCHNVVYVLDNIGEATIDRIVISKLASTCNTVNVIVRGSPYEVDVDYEYTVKFFKGMERVKILSSGSPYPPLYILKLDRSIIEELNSADLILAKGIANVEAYVDSYVKGLTLENVNLIFGFKAKCPNLAETLKVPQNSTNIARWETLLQRGIINITR